MDISLSVTSHEITPDELSRWVWQIQMGKFTLSTWNARPSREPWECWEPQTEKKGASFPSSSSLQEEFQAVSSVKQPCVPKHTGWLMGSPHGFMIFPHI